MTPGQGKCLYIRTIRGEQRVAKEGSDAAAALVFLLLAKDVGQAAQRTAPSRGEAAQDDGAGAVRSVMVIS